MKASELIEHLKSYIDITGGDCEMLVFDKAEGVSCDIKNSSTDGDYVFLYISSANTQRRTRVTNHPLWDINIRNMKKMKIKDCFDKDGNFIKPLFDPYRCEDNDHLYLALFDEQGHATRGGEVYTLIVKHNWSFNCDAVKYYYSQVIDDGCKDNYTAIYAWR